MAVYSSDPKDVLDYLVNWTDWLDDGDYIVSAAVSADSGIDIPSQSLSPAGSTTPTGHTIWVSGGLVDHEYQITSEIWTNGGRRKNQSFTIRVELE